MAETMADLSAMLDVLSRASERMTILLRMDDKMNRQLTCAVSCRDSASALAHELVQLGFIHEADRDKICRLMEESLRSSFGAPPPAAAPRAPAHVAS